MQISFLKILPENALKFVSKKMRICVKNFAQLHFGPKKTLKWMEQNHPIAFVHYKTALEDFSVDSLKNWITYIKNANDTF